MKYTGFALLLFLLMGCTSASKNEEQISELKEEEVKKEPVKKRVILFFGDSITAGYQLDIEDAFPAIIQERLDSLGYEYQVVNAGLSGETTAGGRSRIDWVLRTIPDIFILELGANDGLRGLQLTETRKNLQEIIDRVKEKNPEVRIVLAGMQVPPNLGQAYTQEFSAIFPSLAKENELGLIPFILEGVAGDPELNLADGIHPTPEGHAILAETVWSSIRPLLD